MKRKINKREFDIYLSNEGNGEDKITIKGNRLNCRWIGSSILIWSEKNTDDILITILKEIEKSQKRGSKS